MNASAHLGILSMRIYHFSSYDHPSFQWGALPLLPRLHIYFWFVSHCSWGVHYTTNISPILVQGVTVSIACKGRYWSRRSRFHHKAYLNSSLDRSVPYWEMGRIVRHPPPSQDRSKFFLHFRPAFDLMAASYLSYLSIILYLPTSSPYPA